MLGLTTGVSYHSNTTVCCAKQLKAQPLANILQQCFYAVIVAHAYPTLSTLLTNQVTKQAPAVCPRLESVPLGQAAPGGRTGSTRAGPVSSTAFLCR